MLPIIRRTLPLLFAIAFLIGAFPVSAAPEDVEEIKTIVLTGERNTIPEDVYYYNDQTRYTNTNYRPDSNIFRWNSGRNNKSALVLDGKKQFLRLTTDALSDISAFTFTSWVYWKGGNVSDGEKGQKLLTLYNNEYHYLLVSLHAANTSAGLNGLMIEWATPGNEPKRIYTVAGENSSFSFPTGQWHHVALTVAQTGIALYVDGQLHLSSSDNIDLAEMSPTKLRVGASFAATEKRMNGMLQDAVVYTTALDANQVLLSAQDRDPFSGETATTVTDTLATRPTTEAQEQHRNENGFSGAILGLPAPLIFTVGGIIGAVIVLSIILSILGNRQKKEVSK